MEKKLLYFDGGMGTMLQSLGLKPGEKPEDWNVSRPEEIKKIHKMYLDAGADFITANTFGASPLKYGEGFENIIKSAISIAKKAAEECGHGLIALDIGPTGKLLKPLGDLDFEDAVENFAKQIRAGKGADVILIETMNDSLETKAAVIAAKENSELPVFVTNAYDKTGKLMTGATPEAMVAMLEALGVDALGINCSLGPKQMIDTVKRLVSSSSIPVIVSPNAGLPEFIEGKTVYNVSPEEFADTMDEIAKSGAAILGGCCGTTPDYIKALKEKTKNIVPKKIEDKYKTVVSSYTHAVEFGEKPVLIGERINPTGKKAFKQALRDNDINYILNEGIRQAEAGVDILDVNVGLPEIDEADMLYRSVTQLQAVCNLPLQIDTGDAKAMECALRAYNGKALINSVNGKADSVSTIFPLASKYGGVIIALTLDEDGIPETAEKRFEIAQKIISEAEKYGISKKNIIVDPLAMAVSSDTNSAVTTLNTMKLLKKAGIKTSLGVSNISFGLPKRDMINGTFFTMAMSEGLNAAIMNPFSEEMMKAYKGFLCLSGLDEACLGYIRFASEDFDNTPSKCTDLSDAIIRGLKEKATEFAQSSSEQPLDIIDTQIIPALDSVGKAFETNKIFLPQLLMSAEASKAAFDVLKQKMGKSTASKYPVILATVKGDVHDIGKNIVKVLLENYGYDVKDLGKDVSPEEILKSAQENNAPLVGLSALMTTTVPAMADTIKLLRKNLSDTKIAVGGAVLTEEYAKMVGADKYCSEAMETVRYAESLL